MNIVRAFLLVTIIAAPVLCQSERNAKQVALKRWHEAVTANVSIQLGDVVNDVAFDGSHLWATGRSSGNDFVAKVRASDGEVLLTIPLDNAGRLSYDGLNVWVSRFFFGVVTKIRASDGAVLGSFGAGKRPRGNGFDGQSIWIANDPDFSPPEQSLRKLTIDGSFVQDIRFPDRPQSVAFDGANLWVTRFAGDVVSKVRSSDGVVLGTFSVGDGPTGIAFDGESIWVVNTDGDSVTKLRASDGAQISTFRVGDAPVPILFDGQSIWIANFNDDSLTKISVGSGSVIGTFPTGDGPLGLAFDGASVWVACTRDGTLRKH